MTHVTRRNLLKTGIVASAGLMSADSTFGLLNADAATHGPPAGLDEAVSGVVSPRERLLLDFGWRFHLGNADAAAKAEVFGAPANEATFASVIIPQHPFHPVASPVSADVPIIIGHTRTEYTGLTADAALWHLDEDGMRTRTKELLGDSSEAMIALYRKCNPGATPSDLFFLMESDYRYGAPTMKVAERRAALHQGPVYLFYFAWESPAQGGLLKSPHNIEWPFAFDNAQIFASLTGGGPEAIALADKVSDAWIAFARTGNPNTPKLPH